MQLNFAAINKTNQGDLTIKVANTCGTVSKTMLIDVIDVPQFIQSPNSVTSCLEGSASFIAKVQTSNAGHSFWFPMAEKWIKLYWNWHY